MGTWLGHVAPGTYFFVFSIWWMVRTMQDYFHRQGHYRNTVGKVCCCQRYCCKGENMEAIVIILAALSGVFAEIITGVLTRNEVPLGNIQHLTMYTVFGMGGVIEILVQKKVKFLPEKADYMAILVALVVEMVLFLFHLHGRDVVDIHLHMLLVYSIAACVLAVGFEMYFDKSVQAAIARAYCFMMQGSWFISMGFLLYNPFPSLGVMDLTNPENIMVSTLVFAWHLIGCVLFCLLLSWLAYACNRKQPYNAMGQSDDSSVRLNLLPNSKDSSAADMNGYNSVDEEDSLFVAPTNQ